MKTSARNELDGTIVEVKSGAVMSEVIVEVSEDVTVYATITNDSKEALALQNGQSVSLLIKSSFMILSKEQLRATARNNIQTTVLDVKKGAVNGEVKLSLGDKTLYAVITNESIEELGLAKGDSVYAIFKASSVILVA